MARFDVLSSWRGRDAVLPPIAQSISLHLANPGEDFVEPADDEPQPISAFLCVVDYAGDTRLITCRRYDGIGDQRYVGAVCHLAKGYRQFRCDRIEAVYDARTGEQIGDGGFFNRFALDGWRDRAPTWGLKAPAKSKLVAALNVLSFMARCDGQWHSVEGEVIERFIVSLWIRMNWPGDPDVADIAAHTERLAPDADVFFRSLRSCARDSTIEPLLRRTIGALIAADGTICSAEMDWATEVNTFLDGIAEEQYRAFFADGPGGVGSLSMRRD